MRHFLAASGIPLMVIGLALNFSSVSPGDVGAGEGFFSALIVVGAVFFAVAVAIFDIANEIRAARPPEEETSET